MLKNSRISIIIPTRNEVSTIHATLEQYSPYLLDLDLEIIVSDAHSTDGTAEAVLAWADQYPTRIRLVQQAGKQNIAIGRNAGAKAATGDILFHTDADVRLPDAPLFFKTARQLFENQQLAAFTAPIRVYAEERNNADRVYHWMMNTTIRWTIAVGICLAKGECQVVRRTAFEAIGGYNETLVAGEDCNLFFRLQKTGKVRYEPRLSVTHSPRRFREYGYLKLSWVYFLEGASLLLRRRSRVREWKVVR
jgi:glycosyltransferase involved in cell wall biosynthesis